MYYTPNHFKREEIFSRKTVDSYLENDLSIWRLIDARVTWTLDSLQEFFGTTYVNNYCWGGNNEYRGYRSIYEITLVEFIGVKPIYKVKVGSLESQHNFGRASDCSFDKYSSEEIRDDIRNNPLRKIYKYITAIENDVSWLHFDVRLWDKSKNGILFFNP